MKYNEERCGVGSSTLAFRFIGLGFESEHSLFSHQCIRFQKDEIAGVVSLDDSVRRLL